MSEEPEYAAIDLHIAYGAWLAVMLDRIDAGKVPIVGIDEPRMTTEAHHQLEQHAADDYEASAPGLWNGRHGLHPEPLKHDSPIIDHLLTRLYHAVLGKAWEEDLWDLVWQGMPYRFPSSLAYLMIERPVTEDMISHLGHLNLEDAVLWRLTDEVDEALLTIGKRRYYSPEHDADQFEEVLYAYPEHQWLLSSLAHFEPDDERKLQRLAGYIHRASCRDKILNAALTIPQVVHAVHAIK